MHAYFPYLDAYNCILQICVTGAGGFIASHLAKRLKSEGHYIVACDWKRNEHMPEDIFCDEFHLVDLRLYGEPMRCCWTRLAADGSFCRKAWAHPPPGHAVGIDIGSMLTMLHRVSVLVYGMSLSAIKDDRKRRGRPPVAAHGCHSLCARRGFFLCI